MRISSTSKWGKENAIKKESSFRKIAIPISMKKIIELR